MVTLNAQITREREFLVKVENKIDFWLSDFYFRVAGYDTCYAWHSDNILYIQAIFAAKFPDKVNKWDFLGNALSHGQLIDILRKIFP